LKGRSVAEFVRRGIVTCAPDAGLDEVARAMADNRVHAIFVSGDDPASEPAAILDTDLVAAIATGHLGHFRAANFASANAPTVFLDDDLARAVELLATSLVPSPTLIRRTIRLPSKYGGESRVGADCGGPARAYRDA
jgi:predicted transcriptional regulator